MDRACRFRTLRPLGIAPGYAACELTADQDFDGHSTDASRSYRVGAQRIAPGSVRRDCS